MDGLNSNASTLTILINFPPLELSVKLTSGDKDKSNRIMDVGVSVLDLIPSSSKTSH